MRRDRLDNILPRLNSISHSLNNNKVAYVDIYLNRLERLNLPTPLAPWHLVGCWFRWLWRQLRKRGAASNCSAYVTPTFDAEAYSWQQNH